MNPFSEKNNPVLFPNLPGADILYYPSFLSSIEANHYYSHFKDSIQWQQDNIKLFGKTFKQPRLTALYGEVGKPYRYSGITMEPHPFTSHLKEIKGRVETVYETYFSSVLLNLYRDGNDSMGWHSDDEKELGPQPIIASVSLGAERLFQFRHKTNKSLKHSFYLAHGSLLVMKGTTQSYWQHQVPKSRKVSAARINLTFRQIFH